MKLNRYILLTFALVFAFTGSILAQDVLRLEPYSVGQQYLTQQIDADTTADGRIPTGRIYELEAGAVYLINREMYVEADETLHIRSSSDTDRAIVYMFPTGTGNNPQNPPGNMFRTRGGDIILEGLAIAGYYEPTDIGNEEYEGLYTVQGNLLRTDGQGASIILRRNVFTNINGQILRTEANSATIRLEDNILS